MEPQMNADKTKIRIKTEMEECRSMFLCFHPRLSAFICGSFWVVSFIGVHRRQMYFLILSAFICVHLRLILGCEFHRRSSASIGGKVLFLSHA
jgi:hypothetical protein